MAIPPGTPAPQPAPQPKSDKAIILTCLGLVALLSLVGDIILSALKTGINTEPLTAIASACIGSLGTYLATNKNEDDRDPNEDYELLIGRAATRSMINDMMRNMGAAPPNPPGGGPPVP